MLRSTMLVVVAFALVACVSVTPPTTSAPTIPAGSPTPAVATPVPATSAPIATPTAEPTASPTAEPTATPTEEPTASPTDAPTASPEATPPTQGNDLLFLDNMDDPTSGWDTLANDLAEIVYDVGSLEIAVNADETYAYSGRDLDADFGVTLVAGEFIPVGDGAPGLLCVGRNAAGGDLAYGAVFTQQGAVVFVSIDAGVQTVLETNESVNTTLPAGQPSVLGLGCSATSTGALRLTAFGEGTGPVATYQVDEGPASFDSVAAYAEATTAGFVLDVSAVAAYGIPGSTAAMTPEATELLTHVPSDFRSQCYESPASDGEVAILVCNLQQDGAGAEMLTYEKHVTADAMNAAYQERVEDFGVESQGSCQNGPNETTWSIDDVSFGRVQCAPQQAGIRFDWTDDRLNILSTLVDFEGDYNATYNLWLDAGPNE